MDVTSFDRRTVAIEQPVECSSFGSEKTLCLLFDEIAERYPQRTAITFGKVQMTYRQLLSEADRLARYLSGCGVKNESLVGVFMERTPEAVIALIAVTKAGGAYLPIDPLYPGERIKFVLEDANPVVVLTVEALCDKLPLSYANAICIDRMTADESSAIDLGIYSPARPNNLAYVIYTSGSTGQPKGVMVTHANVVRLLSSTTKWFNFDEADVWTLFHSLAFDFSVWEMWGCLLHGGRLVIVSFSVSRSPEEFYELVIKERVTVLNQTPSAFYQLINVDKVLRATEMALRLVIFGGEALSFRALRPWFAVHGDSLPRLINMYGITETTVHVTYREIKVLDAESSTGSLIGVPIPDMQLYLLDNDGNPVTVGEVGEICVGGKGVARGYLGRPELTAERFVPNSFSNERGARMYKSGDLARLTEKGEIEYLGRKDLQVKIHGFRIELGEIECAIAEFGGIKEARVVAQEDMYGVKRLVAYYVAQNSVAPRTNELSNFLSTKLPPWMLPSVYVLIEGFPLTAHGKIDYAALPEPVTGSARCENVSNSTYAEDKVAGVWREVLGAKYIDPDDNFFDIGGTSLLLVMAHTRLEQLFQRKISVADLFAYTTVRKLSQKLSISTASSETRDSSRENAQKQKTVFARARAARKAAR
jgi:amino acid adenylation domain-containing protein